VDGAKIRVLEKTNQVGLGRFLQSSDGGRLKSEICLEILGDFTDQTLEGELANQKLGRLLISPDFSKSDGSGTVAVRFLDTSRGGGALSRGLGGQLLSWRLTSGRLSGGLLGTCHDSLLSARDKSFCRMREMRSKSKLFKQIETTQL